MSPRSPRPRPRAAPASGRGRGPRAASCGAPYRGERRSRPSLSGPRAHARNRTKLAARAHAVGTKIERRGVVATYKLHDRVGANRASRRRFSNERPQLDETQQRIVDTLRTEGFCVLPFAELFPDAAVWQRLDEDGQRFVDETEAGLAAEAAGGESGLRRTSKEFVVRKNAYGVSLGLDDPWLGLAVDARMLDLANSYLDLWSKLEIRRPLVLRSRPTPRPSDSRRSAGIATSTTRTC